MLTSLSSTTAKLAATALGSGTAHRRMAAGSSGTDRRALQFLSAAPDAAPDPATAAGLIDRLSMINDLYDAAMAC